MTYYFWLGQDAEPLTYMIDPAEWRMVVGSAEDTADEKPSGEI